MKSKQKKLPNEQEIRSPQNRKPFLLLLFGLITLFFISFAATSFILINSYRLSFTGENHASMQQELERLKSELRGKETEIEELKLKLSDYEGESSFANELIHSYTETNR